MSKAHNLSRKYVIDPLYSAEGPRPSAKGLSLFTPVDAGPCWLYNAADLEAWLLGRLRQESFSTCLDVGHPGLHRTFSPTLHARRQLRLGRIPRRAQLEIYHSGMMQVRVNGVLAAHLPACQRPQRRTMDLRPLLKVGPNQLTFRVYSLDQPPTLAVLSRWLDGLAKVARKPDDPAPGWLVSCDDSNYVKPACRALVGTTAFPHQETLPSEYLPARRWDGKLADFGVEILGQPVVNVSRGRGRVTLQAGESLSEARDPSAAHLEQRRAVLDVIPGANTAAENLALRYLAVKSAGSAKIESVGMQASAYPACYRGAFACSDELLSRIWMHSAYTLRLCMREFFIDGIKRDRLPWGGDLYLGMLGNLFAFGERDICRRTLTALYGQDQRKCPTNGIAEYSLYWVLALREYLVHFGDVGYLDYLQRSGQSLDELLQAYAEREDADGFLPSSAFSWVFIDWAEMDKDGVCAPLQMLYAMALDAAAEIAAMQGDSEHHRLYRRRAVDLRRRIAGAFWDQQRGAFVDNLVNDRRGKRIGRHANFMAVLAGVCSPAQRRHIADQLLLGDRLRPVGTPYMAAFECWALARCGRGRQMLDRIRQLWGGMLQRGASSFWEGYDPSQGHPQELAFYGRPYGKSLCHAWSSGPLFLLSRELTGLRPLQPGWKKFTSRPQPAGLDWMYVTVPTPAGSVELACEGGR